MSEAEKPQQDENHIMAERRAKLAALRAAGTAFPNDFDRTHLAGDLQHAHAGTEGPVLEAQGVAVQVAGRMMLKRVMGKAAFATIQDMSGQIQLYVSINDTGTDALDAF